MKPIQPCRFRSEAPACGRFHSGESILVLEKEKAPTEGEGHAKGVEFFFEDMGSCVGNDRKRRRTHIAPGIHFSEEENDIWARSKKRRSPKDVNSYVLDIARLIAVMNVGFGSGKRPRGGEKRHVAVLRPFIECGQGLDNFRRDEENTELISSLDKSVIF